MKTTSIALIFAAAAAAQQADIKYEQFPATGIACPNSDASGNLISNTADLKAAALAARNKTPIESSAANISSGKCSGLRGVPYYSTEAYQTNGELAGSLSFAYDEASQTIYYCLAQGLYSTNGSGYPDSCEAI
ncbi:hypothetical protein SLS57_008333 [Botryosphaeria dothidea]